MSNKLYSESVPPCFSLVRVLLQFWMELHPIVVSKSFFPVSCDVFIRFAYIYNQGPISLLRIYPQC